MQLKIGQRYTRKEISGMLGGSIQLFLPEKNGKVVCGCFREDETFNPGAPEEVLFGTDYYQPAVERTAEMVYRQGQRGETIPIFMKRASARWEYIGNYRCTALLRDDTKLQQKMKAHPQRGVITGILYFEKADS